jgi:hypothetical protein
MLRIARVASRTPTTAGTLTMNSRPPLHLGESDGWKPHGSLTAPDRLLSRYVKGRNRPCRLYMSASDPLRPTPGHAS